jgi:RimJ/RimL family protein N-acetyltransferase
MTLFLNKIKKKEWSNQLKKIGLDQKWLHSINNEIGNEFYCIDYQSQCGDHILVGACNFLKSKSTTECSFFIFPEYRRRGFAKRFITDVSLKFNKFQFSVSCYNKTSLRLFESIPFLLNSKINDRNRTLIYYKKSL